jgi:undecaprenyl-diphosphatase
MVWKMLVLGVVQGVSEFLPISSSGHLLLGQKLLMVEGSCIFLLRASRLHWLGFLPRTP